MSPSRRAGLAGLAVGLLAGCAALPPNSFLDPTKVGMFPKTYQEHGIRRALTPLESPYGIVDATEPTPEDLVPVYEEYRVGPGDNIQVSIQDLLAPGQPWVAVLEVSAAGYIRIPYIGALRVTGMTEEEIEGELRTRVQEAQILPKPIVQVIVTVRRSRFFSAIGDVGNGGAFALVRPDTRLLDVLGQIGDVGPLARKLYIIRRETAPVGPGASPVRPQPAAPDEEELIIPPPDEELQDEVNFARVDEPSAGRLALQQVPDDAQDKFETLLRPQSQVAPGTAPASPPTTLPATVPERPEVLEPPERGFRPLIFDPTTGQLREGPLPSTKPVPLIEPTPEAEEPFEWEAIPEYELSQRVIEIDLAALKAGDPRYNVVLRDRDLIYVPRDTGVFYMMGEVSRPGVYAFGGREITIKQALAIAGGFTPLAWPQRCEIIRRVRGTDRQVTIPVNLDAVFAGLEDDVLLRDNDIVNVGTHIVAPFLFVIRNSFRFTYGFGFVWDRNFADIEAFAGRQNPETIRRARRAQLGLPF